MKRIFVLTFLAFCVPFSAPCEGLKATLHDIISLAQNNVSDEIIITFLETRELNFIVGSKEILQLKTAGVSEAVIRYLLQRIAAEESKTHFQPNYYSSYSYGGSIDACYSGGFFFSFHNFQNSFYPHPTNSKNYFRINGHSYFRHNGHFHQDDTHQYASLSQSAPESFFRSAGNPSWGSKKSGNADRKIEPNWRSNYAGRSSSLKGHSSVKNRSYGSFKNGRTKSGNSWGTKGPQQ